MFEAEDVLFSTARATVARYREAAQRRALAADPAVVRFSHWPDAEQSAFAASVRAAASRSPLDGGGWMNFAVLLRDESYAGDHALLVEPPVAKLGIALMPALRGTGLAREVIGGSLAWLRCRHVTRFQAEIDPDNAASLALFGRAGFRPVRLDADELGPFWVMERS